MAISTVLKIDELDDGFVLAPERYDPRRRILVRSGCRLSEIANFAKEQTSSETSDPKRKYLVFATGDARDGIIRPTSMPCLGREIGSMKRILRPGQVIISRLRPYLRQIALVDEGLFLCHHGDTDNLELLCSSEFYVLESKDEASIAFLVPFLLSTQVQSALAASQEGGHHPRFNERTLRSLPIPNSLLERRSELSDRVEIAVNSARNSFQELDACFRIAGV